MHGDRTPPCKRLEGILNIQVDIIMPCKRMHKLITRARLARPASVAVDSGRYVPEAFPPGASACCSGERHNCFRWTPENSPDEICVRGAGRLVLLQLFSLFLPGDGSAALLSR